MPGTVLGAQGTETEPSESAGRWRRQALRESAKTRQGLLFSFHKEGGSDAWALPASLSTSPLGYRLLLEYGLIPGRALPIKRPSPGPRHSWLPVVIQATHTGQCKSPNSIP